MNVTNVEIDRLTPCLYRNSDGKNKKALNDIEDYGIMTAEFDKNAPTYNVRELSRYCKSKGITADKLTNEELAMLRTN